MKSRPFKLVWTDSCRHTQSFATFEAARRAGLNAAPCKPSYAPCAYIITLVGETLWAGVS